MLFRLCNVSSTFQKYINRLLQEYFDVFCTAYLDDVFIYSKNKEDYTGYVLKVLKRLHEQSLQVNINKCKFSIKKVKYLGMMVTTENIEIDRKKTNAIQK